MNLIPFSPPDITEFEINEVVDTLMSGWITTGQKAKLFSDNLKTYLSTPNVALMSSCTAALELTLRLLNIGVGDEVITTAYTYTATASVIYHTGAKIVLVDTIENSFLIDPEKVQNAITEKTKAVISVDIGGKLCDYDSLLNAVNNKKHLFTPNGKYQEIFNRVVIIADSAHALGSTINGVQCGNFADFTAFSFHAVKNVTTGEGGAITWKQHDDIDNDELAKLFSIYSLHGQTKDAFEKSQLGSWEYDIIAPAYKCNMTDIQASIGLKQLERYESILQKRKNIMKKYDEALLPLGLTSLNHFGDNSTTSYHLYMLNIPNYNEEMRNELIVKLSSMGVSTNVHFKPLPLLTAYKNLGFKIEDFKNAYNKYANEISLPSFSNITDEQINYVIDCIRKSI